MPLTSGTRLGPYEIVAAIGAGGMGEVYRAHDAKLNRDVAIKVLPDLVAADPERLARFHREAQVLAALNHPNIAHIHGFEESRASGPGHAAIHAIVMELVEGEDLSQRIARGAMPLDEALPIAKQIADALEAAHEQGIIHRDLKPANVKVRADGTVKVLDFGLAKALAPEGASATADAMNSPTLTAHGTQLGMILGTAAYMSPEQARGKVADRRSDVWAFGVVLYEMLTGRRAFEGEQISDVLAVVLKETPPLSALPADTPEPVRRLLRRCLEKDRKRRLRDIGDARLELDEPPADASKDPTIIAQPAGVRRRERLVWLGVVGALVMALAGLVWWMLRPPPVPSETRLEITTLATQNPASFALSPDGRRVVYVATANGSWQLWVRSLDAVAPRLLPGTDGARYPFWSLDSRAVAFFADGQLKTTEIDGGAPHVLTTATSGRGGTWGDDGTILFATSASSGLERIPSSGGDRIAVTTLAAGQTAHRFPQWLPGTARQFLYYAGGEPDTKGVYLGSLDGSPARRLADADAAAVYLSPGWLLINQQGTLKARRFDVVQGALSGDSILIADDVMTNDLLAPAFCASATGLVAYRTGAGVKRQLTWFDRAGKPLGTLGAPDDTLIAPELSPDGRRVAVGRTVQGKSDVWIYDALHTEKFTVGPAWSSFPLWSPDGTRIVFRATGEAAGFGLYEQLARGGGGAAARLKEITGPTGYPLDWSYDDRYLLYSVNDPKTNQDVWVLPLKGDGKPFPFLNGTYEERNGHFSPLDARWIAYQSRESGQFEIYVRPFPISPGQKMVSTSRGSQPRWSANGKELYFIAPDGKLMATSITVKGTTIESGVPFELFQTRIFGGGGEIIGREQYAVSSDGHFLISVALDDGQASPITIIQNWRAGK